MTSSLESMEYCQFQNGKKWIKSDDKGSLERRPPLTIAWQALLVGGILCVRKAEAQAEAGAGAALDI